MNWLTYKTLTPELKDEYNFRFKEIPKYNTSQYSLIFIMYVIAISVLFYTASLSIKPENVSSTVNTDIIQLMKTISILFQTMCIILLLTIFNDVFNNIKYYNNLSTWKKNNKIEEIKDPWWKLW